MTKKFYCILLVLLLGITFTNLNAQLSTDPDTLIASLDLDQHPDYGTVKKDDMPVDPNGWNYKNVVDLFPGETVLKLEVKEEKLTGYGLLEHRDSKGQTFYVWHEFTDEDVIVINAEIEDTTLRISHCKNTVYKKGSNGGYKAIMLK